MIKIENTEVYGFEAAIRGMRNPMNSWDKSDSEWYFGEYFIGKNDLKLMKNLSKAGTDHSKVLRYLEVYVDVTAPFYWWKEFKTYRKDRKFMDDGDEFLDPEEFEMFIETNSCSTMHKIHAKEFTLEDFSWEHLKDPALICLENTINCLNRLRESFIETKDKEDWYSMIQLLPSSYNQMRTVKLNYQTLKRMYHARKNHKLDEWREFCKWCEELPYFKEICIEV